MLCSLRRINLNTCGLSQKDLPTRPTKFVAYVELKLRCDAKRKQQSSKKIRRHSAFDELICTNGNSRIQFRSGVDLSVPWQPPNHDHEGEHRRLGADPRAAILDEVKSHLIQQNYSYASLVFSSLEVKAGSPRICSNLTLPKLYKVHLHHCGARWTKTDLDGCRW